MNEETSSSTRQTFKHVYNLHKMRLKFRFLFFGSTIVFFYLVFEKLKVDFVGKPSAMIEKSPTQTTQLLTTTQPFKMINNENIIKDGKIHLLFWGHYFGSSNWKHDVETMSEDYFKKLRCAQTNCVMTHKIDLLPNIYDFDAVIFNIWEKVFSLPRLRSPRQLYIMILNEAPIRIPHDLNLEANLINLTMSYRLDADIFFPYAEIIDIVTGNVIAPSVNVKWRLPNDNFNDREILKLIENKSKTASWVVSNCHDTPSNRADLVQKLQDNGIDVDIYGGCGNQSCEEVDCYGQIRKAKFYLAFENSLCTDYVTEKIYKATYFHIIPVVFSGADLSRFMPPKSYIDANAFKTVEDLANYLKYLMKNPNEFIKYFWWKKHYKVKEQYTVRGEQLCKICQKLNEPNLWERSQFYPSVKAWYGKDVCKNSTIKF